MRQASEQSYAACSHGRPFKCAVISEGCASDGRREPGAEGIFGTIRYGCMRAMRDIRVWFCLKVLTIGPVMSRGRIVRGGGGTDWHWDDGEGGGLGSWGTGGTCGTTMSASALSMVVRRSVKPMVFGARGGASVGEPERDGAVHEEVVEETEDWRPRAHGRAGPGCIVSGDCQRGTDQERFT